MKKLIKFLFIIIVVFLLLAGGTFFYVSKNSAQIIAKFQPKIEQTIGKALNTSLKLGKIDLSIFPNTKFVVDKVSLGSSDTKQGVIINGVNLYVDLIPLLQKKLSVTELRIENPQINFNKTAAGVEIEGLPKKQTAETSKAKNKTEKAKGLPADLSFALDNLIINSADINYKDTATNKTFKLNDLNVRSSLQLNETKATLLNLNVDGNLNHFANFKLENKTLSLDLASGNIDIPNLILNLLGGTLTASVKKTNQEISLNDAAIKIFSGEINTTAKLALAGSQAFNSTLNIKDIDLGKAHTQFKPKAAAQFEGILNKVNLKLNGALSNLMPSLKGSGDILLTNGNLKGTNLPAKVLSAIKDLPFITGNLLDVLPADLRGQIEGEDTPLREVSADFTLGKQTINAKKFKLNSTIFSLIGSGTVDFNQSLNLKSEVIFNAEFSSAFAAKAKELKKVLDEEGRLVLPLTIQGTIKKPIVLPDLKKLIRENATKAIEEKIEKEAGKIEKKIEKEAARFLKKALDFGF